MFLRLQRSALLTVGVLLVVAACDTHKSPTTPTPPCVFTITPTAITIGSDGGAGSVSVTTTAGCAWTAVSANGWLSITAGANGNASGEVLYSVTANAGTSARSGRMTIAGTDVTITQDGRAVAPCTYELSPTTTDFTKDGGSGTFTVDTADGCAWTARSDAGWIVIAGDGTGSGPKTVSYSVARNNDTSSRTGTIALGDRRLSVRQSGDAGACQYSVAPVLFNPCMPAGTATATITTSASCPWTAASNVPWLNVSSASGAGTASISLAYTENYDAPREGVVMVRWPTPTAGQNIRVQQAGCRYAVSRTSIDMPAAGGSATFDVIQQSDPLTCGSATQDRCVWTARSEVPWITITTSMPRSGDNPVAFAVTANDSLSMRTGTILVRDQVVTVVQAGKQP
jgi:hypothetical protein